MKGKVMIFERIQNILILFVVIGCIAAGSALSAVIKEGGKVYIVDRTGYRWDVTQAELIGFKPDGFQYGMGRDYFTPLNDSDISDEADNIHSNFRVIGVEEGGEAKAYSIPKLSRHEIVNSSIGSKPIAAGY